ncbi:MAG: ABC transporter substrate-binding protein [Actinomycetota bacterium]
MLGHPRDRRRPLSRREFLRRAGVAGIATPSLAAVLAACAGETTTEGGSPSAALQLARPDSPVTLPTQDNPAIADGLQPEAGPLKILGYNDYIRKFILNKFSDEFSTSVDWTIFDTPEQMVQMMQSSGSNWDLIVSVTLENVGKLAFGQLIQPLNKTYIPNLANVWKVFQSPFYDVDGQFTAPYTVYTTGMTWRNDVVTEDIPAMDNPYDILWDAKYAGQVHLLNGSRDTLAAALLRMGADVNTSDPNVLDQAKQMLLDGVESMNWKFDHVDYSELGTFEIHQAWSGQVAYYQYYLPKGLPITAFSYVWPPKAAGKKPGIITNDVFAIPKGAKSPVLAHAMIDYLLEESNSAVNYAYEGYQPPLTSITPESILADELVPKNLSNILITEEDFPLGVQELELAPAVNQLYQQIYQDVTGGA